MNKNILFYLLLLLTSVLQVRFVTAEDVIGGELASVEDPISKFTVAIKTFNVHRNSRNYTSICTAVVIADNLLLTAAHCIKNSEKIEITFSRELDVENTSVDQSLIRDADDSYISPDYNERVKDQLKVRDIAVIHFNGGLPQNYQAVTKIGNRHRLYLNETVQIGGYGDTKWHRRSFEFENHRNLRKKSIRFYENIKNKLILNQPESGACFGDSGGPAFVFENDKPLLLGILSMGHEINTNPANYCSDGVSYESVEDNIVFINKMASKFGHGNNLLSVVHKDLTNLTGSELIITEFPKDRNMVLIKGNYLSSSHFVKMRTLFETHVEFPDPNSSECRNISEKKSNLHFNIKNVYVLKDHLNNTIKADFCTDSMSIPVIRLIAGVGVRLNLKSLTVDSLLYHLKDKIKIKNSL